MLCNDGRCIMEIGCAASGWKAWVKSPHGKGHLPTSLLAAVRGGKEGRDSWGQRFPSRLRRLPPELPPQLGPSCAGEPAPALWGRHRSVGHGRPLPSCPTRCGAEPCPAGDRSSAGNFCLSFPSTATSKFASLAAIGNSPAGIGNLEITTGGFLLYSPSGGEFKALLLWVGLGCLLFSGAMSGAGLCPAACAWTWLFQPLSQDQWCSRWPAGKLCWPLASSGSLLGCLGDS